MIRAGEVASLGIVAALARRRSSVSVTVGAWLADWCSSATAATATSSASLMGSAPSCRLVLLVLLLVNDCSGYRGGSCGGRLDGWCGYFHSCVSLPAGKVGLALCMQQVVDVGDD